MTTIQMIPLDKLYPSPANVRKTAAKDGIEGLANSIHNHGLLQNLIVQPGGEKATFSVLAGGRRLAALNHPQKAHKLPADWPVPCNVIEIEGDISSEEISLAENEMRQAMHPADQFEAFKRLADEGQGHDTIAAKFGVTPHVVKQRLKLAVVSPKLIKAYRDGEMELEQLMAFTLSTDQKQQEKIWKELPVWARERGEESPIRRAITGKHIPSDNDIAQFVGIEAYEAAGGQVLRDLFSEDEVDAYLANPALLDKLAGEKLEQIAVTVRAEGWKWVGIFPDLPYSEESKYTKRPVKHSHTPEAKAEAVALRKQIAAIEKEHDDAYDRPDAVEQQLDELQDKLNAAEEGTELWTPKDRELAGAIVTIDEGKAKIMRGLMKPEEARAAKKAETAKVKAKSKGAKTEDEEAGVSQSLARELTAHLTAGIQAKLAKNPKVALVAVIHALVSDTIRDGDGDICSVLQIRPSLSRFEEHAEGINKSKAFKEIEAALDSMDKKLPDDGLKLWAWLLKQDTKELLEILAVCAAPTADVVGIGLNPEDEFLAAALKLDMTGYWEATAESYLERVSKDQAIVAVTEACGKAAAAPLAGMKRAALAKAAEKLIKGKGWLPEILRGAE